MDEKMSMDEEAERMVESSEFVRMCDENENIIDYKTISDDDIPRYRKSHGMGRIYMNSSLDSMSLEIDNLRAQNAMLIMRLDAANSNLLKLEIACDNLMRSIHEYEIDESKYGWLSSHLHVIADTIRFGEES